MNLCKNFFKNSIKNVYFHEIIGRGTFGQVFKATYKKKIVAVKKIEKNIFNELEYLIACNNKSSEFLCFCMKKKIQNDFVYLIFDYYNGDLYSYLENNEFPDENEIKFFIYQMLLAVEELNFKGYIHLDIKLENFILKDNKKIILTDFGCAKRINYNDNTLVVINKNIGTLNYIAPEISLGYYCNKSDLWSIGICMFVMMTNTFYKLKKFGNKFIKIENYSNNCNLFLNKLLEKKIDYRLNIEYALNNQWILN